MKFLVQFYSHHAQKYVTISTHKTLKNAVKRSRHEYTTDKHYQTNKALTILVIVKKEEHRLDMYGAELFENVDYNF